MKAVNFFFILIFIVFLFNLFFSANIAIAMTEGEMNCMLDCQIDNKHYNWDEDTQKCECTTSYLRPDPDSPPPVNPPPTNGQNTINIGPPSWAGGAAPENIDRVIENVTNWVLGIAGSLAVLFIIIAGIRYITSAGNQQQHEAAKKNLTSAIIGLVIVILSWVIVTVIMRALTS